MFELRSFVTVGLFVVLVTILYLFVRYKNNYWTRKGNNIPSICGIPFYGNFKDVFTLQKSMFYLIKDIYNHENVKNESLFGINILMRPAIVIRDPELIKNIMVKDAAVFPNRHMSTDAETDSMGYYNLLMIKSPLWKDLKTQLSPAFTISKMKKSFKVIDRISQGMVDHISTGTRKAENTIETELKEICARYTTDIIASTFFGVEANCIRNDDSEFRYFGRKIFEYDMLRGFQMASFFFMPEMVPYLRIKLFPSDTEIFLRAIMKDVISTRERTGENRNDLIDLLLKLKKEGAKIGDSDIEFKDDILVAQAATFYMASFETTSSVLSFGLYELAMHPEIQEKLRMEIREMVEKYGDDLPYDCIVNEMIYLEMVVSETARLYPVLPFLERQCIVPKGSEGYSLQPYHNFVIPHGMPVLVPIYAIQRDPKYFADPDTFDPERFSKENRGKIIPYTYMPFGVGPRSCIGSYFGALQVKMAIVKFLKKFRLVASESTPKTLTFCKNAFNLQSEQGLFIDLQLDEIKNGGAKDSAE